MPTYLLKVEPDLDLYVLWSTVVDGPTYRGRRAGIEAMLQREHPAAGRGPDFDEAIANEIARRFDRADEYGSSGARHSGMWGEALWLMNGPGAPGTLPREHLRAYLDAELANPDQAAALVTPYKDED